MAAMYAVYHGPSGLKDIANRVHSLATAFADAVEANGHSVVSRPFFDTVAVKVANADAVLAKVRVYSF